MEKRMIEEVLSTSDYDITLLTNFVLTLLLDTSVQDFCLFYDDNFSDANNIRMNVKTNTCIEKYLIESQLRSNPEIETLQLYQFFESYKEMTNRNPLLGDLKYVLYTNVEFDKNFSFDNGQRDEIKILNVTNEEPLLNSLGVSGCQLFKLQICNSSEREKFEIKSYENFCKKFFICKGPIKIKTLKQKIERLFHETFKCNVASCNLYPIFEDWQKKFDRKAMFQKKFLKMEISKCLLSPYIRGVWKKDLPENFTLQEAILNFDITLLENIDQAKAIFGEIFMNNAKIIPKLELTWPGSTEEFNPIPTSSSFSSFTIVAVEVLRSQRQSIHAAIKFSGLQSNNLKFLLIDDVIDTKQFTGWKILHFLTDLRKERKIYDKVTKNLQISVQTTNNKISLKEVIASTCEVEKLITTSHLVQMTQGKFSVGITKTRLPENYIETYLLQIAFNVDAIVSLTFNSNDVTIISCKEKLASIKPQLRMLNIIEISTYLVPKANIQEIDELETQGYDSKFILVAKRKCTEEEFNQICKKDPKRVYHHVQVTEDENLEWLKSSGSVKELKQHRLKINYLPKPDLSNYDDNKLQIICGLPGMGKSVMMNHLKKSHPPNFWIHEVNLEENSHYFKTRPSSDEPLQFVLNSKTNYCYYKLDLLVRKIFESNKKIVIMWDGLDKLPDDSLDVVLKTIKQISNLGFAQWITARNYLKPMLEDRFNTLALEICEFNEEFQRRYIEAKLWPLFTSHHLPIETDKPVYVKQRGEVQTKSPFSIVTAKIIDKICSIQNNGQIGTPILLFLLSELCLHKSCPNLEEVSLFDLYINFVEKKFESCFSENLPAPLYEDLKNQRLSQYEIASMKIWFDNERLYPFINCNQFLNNIKKSGDPFDIISQITICEKPIFNHSTVAEYFAASYLRDNFRNIPNLKKLLFSDRFQTIRFFLDLALVNNNCYAHQAVLYKNFDLLMENDHTLHLKDMAGRSPLHLAASYGEKHPNLPIERKNSFSSISTIFLVNTESRVMVEDDSEFQEIVKFLSSKLDSSEVDLLWNMNCIQYAIELHCFSSLESLMENKRTRPNFTDLEKYKHTVLYYSTRFNYKHLFKLFNYQPLIVERSSGRSLLHLAAEFNRKELLEIFLKNLHSVKILSDNPIDNVDANEDTPLHLAAMRGHMECVQLLVFEGANLNSLNKIKLTPLHAATINGQLKVVKFLRKNKAKVSIRSKEGQTPFHAAAKNGHLEIMKFLIESQLNKNPLKTSDKSTYYRIKSSRIGFKITITKKDTGIEATENHGFTPLHFAAQSGNVEIVQILIGSGADINAVAKNNWTPLHMAINGDHSDVLSLLMEAGANTKNLQLPLLHFAVQYKRAHLAKLLIENEHTVALNASPSVVRKLGRSRSFLEKIFEKKVVRKQSWNLSPLHIATENNDLDIIKFLIEKGAAIEDQNPEGNTVLFVAARSNYCSAVNIFLEAGADLTVLNDHGWSALHTAAKQGHLEVVKTLLQNGAPANIGEDKGFTPLHVAALMGHTEVMEMLIVFGANPRALDKNGRTSLELAQANNKPDSVTVLERYEQ